MSRKLGLGAVIGTLTASLVLGFAISATPAADAHYGPSPRASTAAFHDAMRQLWEDHIVWTRQFIVSAATGAESLDDLIPTRDRLLANQTHIGDALKPFYGDAVGEQVTALLRDHIVIAAELVAAAKAKDQDAVAATAADWYQNGDDIAVPARQFFTEDGRQLKSDAEISAYLAGLEAEKRRRLNNVCETPRASQEHALIELCAWIGQHR